jgi:hypothetical protein
MGLGRDLKGLILLEQPQAPRRVYSISVIEDGGEGNVI